MRSARRRPTFTPYVLPVLAGLLLCAGPAAAQSVDGDRGRHGDALVVDRLFQDHQLDRVRLSERQEHRLHALTTQFLDIFGRDLDRTRARSGRRAGTGYGSLGLRKAVHAYRRAVFAVLDRDQLGFLVPGARGHGDLGRRPGRFYDRPRDRSFGRTHGGYFGRTHRPYGLLRDGRYGHRRGHRSGYLPYGGGLFLDAGPLHFFLGRPGFHGRHLRGFPWGFRRGHHHPHRDRHGGHRRGHDAGRGHGHDHRDRRGHHDGWRHRHDHDDRRGHGRRGHDRRRGGGH